MNEVVKEADSLFLKVDDTIAHQKNLIIKENSSKPYAPNLNRSPPKNERLMGRSSNLGIRKSRNVNEERGTRRIKIWRGTE
jgi:hypothetical protein